jgi:hypothetical protein
MIDISSLKFVLRDEEGQCRALTVDSDVALVGSGAHCEIRLPAEQAATEQLRVETRAGAVFAEVRSVSPVTLLNGVPFTQGRLLPESTLQVGTTELSVVVTRSGSENRSKPEAETTRSKAIYALAVLGFPLGFWLLLTAAPESAPEVAAVPAPPLFAAAEAACPEQAAGPAAALAETELARAESSRERAPFAAEEGVNAVALYSRSAACFRVAERTAEAARVAQAAEELKRKMNQEFRLHQVRLEWAQATRHYDEARTEVRLLLSFVGRRGGEYSSWLSALDRQIELKYSGKKD